MPATRRALTPFLCALCVSSALGAQDDGVDPFLIDTGESQGGGCDPGPPTIQVRLPSGFAVSTLENGEPTWFDVRLRANPNQAVTLELSVSDPREGFYYVDGHPSAHRTLTFQPWEWQQYKRVYVGGWDDDEMDGDVAYSFWIFNTTNVVCPDGAFVQAYNEDDELIRLSVSPSWGLSTDEMGTVVSSQVSLFCNFACAPTHPVVVSATSADATKQLVRAPGDPDFRASTVLTFDAGQFNTSRTLQMTGTIDGHFQGHGTNTVSLLTSSQDPRFHGLRAEIRNYHNEVTDVNPCASGVVQQILTLPFQGQRILLDDAHFPAGEYDGGGFPIGNHIQGVARTRGEPFLMLTGDGEGASNLFAAHFPVRAGVDGRWGELVPVQSQNTIVNHHDGLDIIDWGFDHAGGLSIFGSFAAIPLQGEDDSKVVFTKLYDPERPERMDTNEMFFPGYAHSGAVAVVKSNGTYLVVVEGDVVVNGEATADLRFYRSQTGDIRQPQSWTFLGRHVGPHAMERFNGMNFVRDCDGTLFLLGFHNSGPGGLFGVNEIYVYLVTEPAGLPDLSLVATRWFGGHYNSDQYGNFDAGAGAYVDEDHELILYATEFYRRKGGEPWLRLMEW